MNAMKSNGLRVNVTKWWSVDVVLEYSPKEKKSPVQFIKRKFDAIQSFMVLVSTRNAVELLVGWERITNCAWSLSQWRWMRTEMWTKYIYMAKLLNLSKFYVGDTIWVQGGVGAVCKS